MSAEQHSYYRYQPQILKPKKMKLTSSASEQNILFSYVCLVNDIIPSGNRHHKGSDHNLDTTPNYDEEVDRDDQPIKIGRTKALHELIESEKKAERLQVELERKTSSVFYPTTSGEDKEISGTEDYPFLPCDNPNVLKLTKMKWLTEEQDGAPDSRSPSLSPASSNSYCSIMSEDETHEINDRHLSTILQLDKEHNMFGLSNIAIVGTKLKQKRKEDDKPVFHQTAIVQICCSATCCKHKSNTDLPTSLKMSTCGKCRICCLDPCYKKCSNASLPLCYYTCPTRTSVDSKAFGFQVTLNRKPKYSPPVIELIPRASSILQKPMAARSCHHVPSCVPPSNCFPYLMPCYWPASSGAPCSNPTQCFHNPPCPAPRKRQRVPYPDEYTCPKKCTLTDKGTRGAVKCPNETCLGKIPSMKEAIEKRFGAK